MYAILVDVVWCFVALMDEFVYLQSRMIHASLLGFSQNRERDMALTDQTLVCRDCNAEFIFTVGEQEFYASHRLTNTPSRCPSCRAARKTQGGGFSGGRGGSREPRQMYTATCSSCGNEAQVPFQPRGDKPVYCSDCYQAQDSGRSSDRRSRW